MSERRPPSDWADARKLHELEGWTFTAIGELLDVTIQCVSDHARREQWISKAKVIGQARASALRKFVERDSAVVYRHLTERHELVRRMQGLIGRHVARLEDDVFWAKVIGYRDGEPILAHEDPADSLRKLGQSLKSLQDIDTEMLKDATWRTGVDKPALPDLPADFDWSLLRKRKQEERVQ